MPCNKIELGRRRLPNPRFQSSDHNRMARRPRLPRQGGRRQDDESLSPDMGRSVKLDLISSVEFVALAFRLEFVALAFRSMYFQNL